MECTVQCISKQFHKFFIFTLISLFGNVPFMGIAYWSIYTTKCTQTLIKPYFYLSFSILLRSLVLLTFINE